VLIAGVVNKVPVAIGAPPLLEVYQFTPAFEAEAFRVTGPEPQIEPGVVLSILGITIVVLAEI
jgi:hypothetical protein